MIQILVDDVIQIIQVSVLIVIAISMIREKLIEKSVTAGLYLLGTIVYIVTDLYWIAHLIIKSGQTPQFSAAEIGVMGIMLFYGAAIRVRMQPGSHLEWTSYPVILAAAFTLVNTVCWGLWNGGWIRDALTGIAMGYCACVLAARMVELGIVSHRQWVIAGITCAILMAVEVGTVYVPSSLFLLLEIIRYAIWFSGIAYFCFLIYRFLLRDKLIEEGLCCSVAGYLWSAFTLYLSAGVMYTIGTCIVTIMTVFVWLAVRREAVQQ